MYRLSHSAIISISSYINTALYYTLWRLSHPVIYNRPSTNTGQKVNHNMEKISNCPTDSGGEQGKGVPLPGVESVGQATSTPNLSKESGGDIRFAPRPPAEEKAKFSRLQARLVSTGHKVVSIPYLNKSNQPKRKITLSNEPPPILQLQKASAINSVRQMKERITQAKLETGKSLSGIDFPTIQQVLPVIASRGSPTRSEREIESAVSPSEEEEVSDNLSETEESSHVRGLKRDVSEMNEGVDPLEFIACMKRRASRALQATGEHSDSKEFVYLDFANDAQYNPYDLKIVPHSEINPNDFFTLSSAGITKTTGGLSEFTPLNKWEREHHLYQGLIKIPLIRKFRCWKAFTVWRKNVRAKKMKHCADRLTKSLFFLDHTLSTAIMDVRHLCQELGTNRLYQISNEGKYTLSDFDDNQKDQASEITEKLEELQEKTRDIVYFACVRSLQEAGFAISYEQDADLSYTDQAAKRAKCARLTNYIKVCDYLIFTALQKLVITSMEDLSVFLKTSSLKDWLSIGSKEIDESSEESKGGEADDRSSIALFQVELVMDDTEIVTSPSVYEVHAQMEFTLNLFMETVLKMEKLWMDKKFDDFTSPNINPNLEFESELSEGPEIAETFDQDDYYKHLQEKIEFSIDHAFKDIMNYTVLMEEHKQIYLSNKAILDQNSIRSAENDLDFFSESLEKYGDQYEVINEMIESKQVQFFWVISSTLKEKNIALPKQMLGRGKNVLAYIRS